MAAQAEYYNAQIRHGIGIRNLASGYVNQLDAVLAKANAELEAKLATSLKQGMTPQSARWQALQKDIKELRTTLWRSIGKGNASDMRKLAKAEQEFAKSMLEAHIPVRMEFATVSPAQLNALVMTQPFAGGTNAARTLGQWWAGVARADQARILESLQLGMLQGESVPSMMRRVQETLPLTRANAEAVVRTGVNHATNSARDAFYQANDDIISELMWSAMLDGRTSPVCRGRDGHYAPTDGVTMTGVSTPHLDPPGARPPAHPNCRSQMLAGMNADGIAAKMPARPFVRDTRTRRWREKDFRADAHAAAGDKKWKRWSPKQRNAAIKRQRTAWARKAVGVAPAGVSYDSWLRKQPVAFQNDVLGVAKGKAFRKGLKLDQFTDRSGAELTLVQLKAKFPTYVTGA